MEYDTREAIESTAIIDPELQQYLERPADQSSDGANVKAVIGSLDHPVGKTIDIPMRDGHLSQLRIHAPENASGKATFLVVLLFGGGFMFGDNAQLSLFAQAITKLYGATVINTSYRLAPQHLFPVPFNDTWDSLKWMADNHEQLGVDLNAGFIIGGVSAGANLAAAVAKKWQDEKVFPAITGQIIILPLLFTDEIVPEKYKDKWFSRDQNADVPGFNLAQLENVMTTYAPDVRSPDFSPVNSKIPYEGLGPVFLAACGMDPLRDDALVYHRILQENGVKSKLAVYPGMTHGHLMVPGLKATRDTSRDIVKAVGWIRGDEKSNEEADDALSAAQLSITP